MPTYQALWLRSDLLAGKTLGAYALPEGVAMLLSRPAATGWHLWLPARCVGYALFGSSRHVAIGPTSAISLMVGASVPPVMAGIEYPEIVTDKPFGAGPFGGLHHGERCDRTEQLNTVKLMVRL